LPGDTPATGCITDTFVPYCAGSVDLWDAALPGAAGGGIVFITAAALEMDDSSTIVTNGVNSGHNNIGGAGGTVFLRVQNLVLGSGTTRVLAQGGGNGAPGRIKIDAQSVDVGLSGCVTATTPTASCVSEATDTVQSITVLSLPSANYTLATAEVLPVAVSIPEINGVVDPVGSLAASNISLSLTEDGSDFAAVAPATAQASFGPSGSEPLGQTVAWLMSTPGPVGSTRGFAAMFVPSQ
jgi:hypothetical protein